MRKLYLLAGIALFTVSKAQTDTIKRDTVIPAKSLISYTPTSLESKPKFFQKEWVKKSSAPSILFVASAATWGQKEQIRENRILLQAHEREYERLLRVHARTQSLQSLNTV